MKRILFIGAFILSSFTYAQSTNDYPAFKRATIDISGGFHMPVDNQMRTAIQSPNGLFSLDIGVLPLSINHFTTNLNIGFGYGSNYFEDVLENIEFDGGYMGYFEASCDRITGHIGGTIGYQPHRFIEFSVPASFSLRYYKNTGHFKLYDGQEIQPEDLIDENEARVPNNPIISEDFSFGFKTGLEIVLFPNFLMSPFVKVNYEIYGNTNVWDVKNASLHTFSGEMNYPNYEIPNSSELVYLFGLRINASNRWSISPGSGAKPPKKKTGRKSSGYKTKPEKTKKKDVKLTPSSSK